MPSCMDDKYKVSEDPIENYRNYYREGKKENTKIYSVTLLG